MTSLIHWLYVGGRTSFHLNRISLLANKEQKAIMLRWLPEKVASSGATPNSEIRGDGCIVLPHIPENASKMDCQKLCSLGHSQNMCSSVAGPCLHRSHVGSIPVLILDNLSLDQWSRCTILNWTTVCLRHIEEEWICCIIFCHVLESFQLGLFPIWF